MSGLSILKRAECQSVKIPGLDDLPHQQRRPCRETSCCDLWNRRLTVREVADEVGISIGFCHQIFTEKFQMRRVSAKFMPRLLTDD